MVRVVIRGPENEIEIVAFLDEGSTITLLDASIAKSIGLTGKTSTLCCEWTGGVTRRDENSAIVDVEIRGMEEGKSFHKLNRVRTFKNLNLPHQYWDATEISSEYPYTGLADLSKVERMQPMMLIGQDNCDLIVSRECVQPNKSSPMVSKTKLGWVIHGPVSRVNNRADNPGYSVNICCEGELGSLEGELATLHNLVKSNMTLENFGAIIPQIDHQKSVEERHALLIADQSIQPIGGHYQLRMPYKDLQETMVESKKIALRRLECTERRIIKENIGDEYDQIIQSYIKKGYAVRVRHNEIPNNHPKLWYLPHFPVINANKPGKIRMVFDAAAKSQNYCLNDYLVTGPDWVPSLFGILCRFREEKIGICGDIAEMFHHVRISEFDSWSQCFLWRNLETMREPDVYRMNAMIFGAKCSPFMAQYVKNYNAEKYRHEFPEAAEAIIKQHYVDDFTESISNELDAIQLVSQVINIQQEAGFTLRNFICNNEKVLSTIPEHLVAPNSTLDFEKQTAHKVLGMKWNAANDCFQFHYNFNRIPANIINGQEVPTKLEVLKVSMSIFDPIGFLSPITIASRILLQKLWKTGIRWDQQIPDELAKKWFAWLDYLTTLNSISIQRCLSITRSTISKLQLHIFCDASESAYSAVSYLRIDTDGIIEISFVASKSRVSPTKTITIPKLELMAAVLGVRMSKIIIDEMRIKIDQKFFWSDSMTVISWLRTHKKLNTFIASRVGEILEFTEVGEWHWIPTNLNPADKATRDNFSDFNIKSDWFEGPKFLMKAIDSWPKEKVIKLNFDFEAGIESEVVCGFTQQKLSLIDTLPNISHFSKYSILLRSTVRVQRFIENISSRKTGKIIEGGEIKADEIRAAEIKWFKAVQQQHFNEEIHCVARNIHIRDKRFHQISLFLDENEILRVKGRIEKSIHIQENVKHPILLEGKSHFVKLLVMHYHEKNMHQGRETVLNDLKQKFYFIKMRSIVYSILSKCQMCIVNKCKPDQPSMAALPNFRLEPNLPPFTYVGIDYFGPMTIKIGRRLEKRWGVIFTCLVCRAIHLELSSSLSTDAVILALRRFQARRGIPKKIYSDCGTNFKGATNELKNAIKEINYDVIRDKFTLECVEWHFNPPGSPHFGGCWERLIGCVKSCLHTVIKEKHPREESLQTFLVEAENIVNSRPLTYVSTDPEDLESLTPNHFLIHRQPCVSSPGLFTSNEEFLRKQWRLVQYWTDEFWRRWIKEYIPSLLISTKWHKDCKNLEVGDIVKITNENTTRGEWPIGRIIKVYTGSDGTVRVADVKTSYGCFQRPAVKLAKVNIGIAESIPGVENVTLSNINKS